MAPISRNIGTASIRMIAETSQFENSLRRTLKNAKKNMASVFAVGAGIALGATLAKAVQETVNMEKQMALLSTIVDENSMATIFNVEQQRKLAAELGLTTKELTDAQYLAASSGIADANVNKVVAEAHKFAAATAIDQQTAINGLTSAMNAYGSEGVTAAQATDIFFRAAELSKGSIKDFTHYISSAIPAAKNLGVSLNELASLGALNTQTGQTARVAFTGLKVAMQEMQDTSKGAGKVFKDEFGKSFKKAMKDSDNQATAFMDTMVKFTQRVGTDSFYEIFGAKEGANAILQVAALEGKLGDVQTAMMNIDGVNKEAFAKVSKTTAYQLQTLQARWTQFLGSIGDQLGPAIREVAQSLISVMGAVEPYADDVGNAILAIVKVLNELKPVIELVAVALTARLLVGLTLSAAAMSGAFVTGARAATIALFGLNAAAGGAAGARGAAGLAAIAGTLSGRLVALAGASYIATAATIKLTGAQKEGKSTLESTNEVVKIGAGYLGGGLVKGLAGATAGFGLFDNEVSRSLNNTGQALITTADTAGRSFNGMMSRADEARVNIINDMQAIAYSAELAAEAMSLVQKASDPEAFARTGGYVALQGPGALGAPAGIIVEKRLNDEAVANWKEVDEYKKEAARIKKEMQSIQNSIFPESTGWKNPNSGGGGGGASKAEARADKIKTALSSLVDVFIDLRKNIGGATADQIESMFEKIYEGLNEADQRKFKAVAVKTKKELLKQAAAYDTVTKSLEEQRTALQALTDEGEAFRKSLSDSIKNSGNITGASPHSFKITFQNISVRMKKAVDDAKKFTAAIGQLRKMNLNDTLLRQLMEAGPGALDNVLAITGAGTDGIKQLNQYQTQLDKMGEGLGQAGYDEFYKNGIKIADGLVKGLESQQEKIGKMMEKIADRMIARWKKVTDTHSPSRVFADLGAQIPAGLAQGINSNLGAPVGAMRNMNQSITFGPGAVQVTGVAGQERKSGVGAGLGIVSVLQSRGVAAALNGTR